MSHTINLEKISKDPELNDLWNKFCDGEERLPDEEVYKIAEDINKRLQDIFNDHNTDIVGHIVDLPIDCVHEVVKIFVEETSYTCKDCGTVFCCDDDNQTVQIKREREKKIGRNDPCPCGSGKKYKKCCGRIV
ncbi:MAG: SEC-C metal-binding domain-containing protein [Halobacteriota archaeon]